MARNNNPCPRHDSANSATTTNERREKETPKKYINKIYILLRSSLLYLFQYGSMIIIIPNDTTWYTVLYVQLHFIFFNGGG